MTVTELIHRLEAFAERFPDAKVFFRSSSDDEEKINYIWFSEPPQVSTPEIILSMENMDGAG